MTEFRHVERHGAEPVEAAWEALRLDLDTGGPWRFAAPFITRHRPLIEAALRAAPEPGLRAAAAKTADWLDNVQLMYHTISQGFPRASRGTCEAGMCGDYREHRDALRAALVARTPTEDPDGH